MTEEKLKKSQELISKIRSLKNDLCTLESHKEISSIQFTTNYTSGRKIDDFYSVHLLNFDTVKYFLITLVNKELSILQKEFDEL